MSVVIDLVALNRELADRSWTKGTLAKRAALSPHTVSRIYKGESVSSTTAFKIKVALLREPPAMPELARPA